MKINPVKDISSRQLVPRWMDGGSQLIMGAA